MGAQMLRNGTGPVTSVNWFDNITIKDPTVQNAYFFVSGSQTTPDGLYYDTELTFGGENNGEATNFTQMNATLGIFYYDAATKALDSFPSLYSFGGDTAEAADNLQVSYAGNGFSQVTTGTPDYVYLGSTSATLTLPLTFPFSTTNLTSSTTNSGQSTSASGQSGTSTGTSMGTTTSTSLTGTSQASTSSSGSASSLPAVYSLVVLICASVIALAAGMGSRLRERKISHSVN
jgi:thermopsin